MMLSVFAFGLQVATMAASHAIYDLTPPEPLPLGGYTARQGKTMELGGEKLYARTLILAQNSKKVAIVSLDMLTVPESLVREVRSKVGAGIDLMLVATHTHSGVDSQMLNDRMTFAIPGISSYKSKWLEWYSNQIAAAIKDAVTKPLLLQTTLEVIESNPGLNRGRREGAKPIATATEVKGSFGFFYSYAAHATLLNDKHNQPSGDWPGRISDLLNSQVLPGAIGDVSPKPPGSGDLVQEFASQLVESSKQGKSRKVTSLRLAYLSEPIELDPIVAHPDFAKDNKIPAALAKNLVTKFAPATGELTLIKIGDIVIVGVPGEPTSDLGRRIIAEGRKVGFKTVLPISHVNGWIGYILESKDYTNGGYEATLAFHGPKTANRVVEATKRGLRKLGKR